MNFIVATVGLVLGIIVIVVFLPLFNSFIGIADSTFGSAPLLMMMSMMVVLIVAGVLYNFIHSAMGNDNAYGQGGR